MKSKLSLPLLVITALITSLSFSKMSGQQAPRACGTDIMTQQLLAAHPELWQKYVASEARTQAYIKNLEAAKTNARTPHSPIPADSPVYIIPIVFHVLHENGPENISDAQIMSEMKVLNEDWGHRNPDTGYAVNNHFKSIEGNMKVEFRLAKIDPNGNCTNGIDRIYTNLTNQATDLSKLNDWDRSKYLNVWVCKSINSASAQGGTILGYAYFPFEADGNPLADGVLIASNCIGTIGTATLEFSRCLSHEIGHVMNLEHPWGLTNSPGVTGPYKYSNPPEPCGDDAVGDTPDTKGFYSFCPTGIGNDLGLKSAMNLNDTIYAEICDTVSRDTISKNPLQIKYKITTENFQNFMDYSFCSMMFTEGQQERVWAALNSTEAQRTNLWDTANLIATGVLDITNKVVGFPHPSECAPVANFYANTCFVCQGSKVDFYDNSTNAEPTNWLWTFTGATTDTSKVSDPIVTFNSPYMQTVTLTVSDSVGSSTQTKSGYIYVSPLGSGYFGTYSEGFENSTEVNNNWLFYNYFNDGITWKYTNAAASTGTGSIMVNSYQHTIYDYQYNPPIVLVPAVGPAAVWTAITPSIDLSTTTLMTFSFDYSCATEASASADITDTLEVDFSTNCGASWFRLKSLTGTSLTNAGHHTESYVPSSPSDWEHVSFALPAGITGVNNKPNVRFRFKYVSGGYSNNAYVDNVNLSGTVGVTPVTSDQYHLLVYPNPMSAQATISYYLPSDQSIQVGLYDITGRELKELLNGTQIAGQHALNLNNDDLSNGVYFIKMSSGNSTPATQKLIVIK